MRYLITGATGYVGSMLVKYICKTTPDADVTVLVRDREKAAHMLPECVRCVEADLTDPISVEQLDIPCDGLIHCAAVTKSAVMQAHPSIVTRSIVDATENICELALRSGVKSMVYLSSMEVYGNINCEDGHRVREEEAGQGTVDVLSARSCYPLAKRMAENLCYSYYAEYGLPVKIARLALTFGEGILPGENRVFAQFARAAVEKRDIVLHTQGKSMGNYCGIRDAVRAIMLLADRGENGEAYNVVNEANTRSIREMAQLVATEIANGEIQVTFDIPESNAYGYAADTGLRLSGQKMMALGWTPTQGLVDLYRDMVAEME